MRILWVSEVDPDPNSGAGGTELLFVQQLRSLGHDVTTVWAGDLPRRIRHGNLHYAFELPRSYWNAIRRECTTQTFDVVTVNLGQSYLAARRLRQSGFEGAFIVRSHGLDDHLDQVLGAWESVLGTSKRSLLKRAIGAALNIVLQGHMRKAVEQCDGYVVSNSLDGGWLSRVHGLSTEKIAVIPQAPSAAFLQTAALPLSEDRRRRLLYVANFHFAKGPHAVASAAAKLLSQDPSLQMTWICHPHDHSQVRELFSGSLPERLKLLGWMPQEELVRQFDQHGIFLYPSLFDGFGKVFLEAMARGLCVVGTRAGGMVDLIENGENGFHCEFNQPEQIVAQVQQLVGSAELAQRVSSSAARTALQYTWQRAGAELGQFFETRLASVRGTS
jgi:glycosyltransferase involved in cell wall biosynthesis